MPVKIKHVQLRNIKWVDYNDYYHHYKDNNLYKTLAIKDIYELYNRKDGAERWQATIEKDNAFEALKKHPDIFRIEYSDKNSRRYFLGLSDLFLNKKIVLYTIKNGIVYGKKVFIGIWKFIVLILATFLGGWLAIDHNYEKAWNWLKTFF